MVFASSTLHLLPWETTEYLPNDSTQSDAAARGAAYRTGALCLSGDIKEALRAFDRTIASMPSDKFAKAWILEKIATEFSRLMIEDEAIDASNISAAAVDAFRYLIKNDDWLNPKLVSILSNLSDVAKQEPLRLHSVELQFPISWWKKCRIRAVIPHTG